MDRHLKTCRRSRVALMLGTAVACLATAGAVFSQTLVDPTRPAQSAVGSGKQTQHTQSMRVEAIFSRGVHRTAIVDGQLVKAGDRLGEKVILEITPQGVRYVAQGSERFARLETARLSVRRAPEKSESTP